VRLAGNEGEASRLMDPARRHKKIVGPEPDAPIADCSSEGDAVRKYWLLYRYLGRRPIGYDDERGMDEYGTAYLSCCKQRSRG
jgi:hypothetical protein